MVRRTRVYVAGPIYVGDPSKNVVKAADAGLELVRKGYAPFIPHLMYWLNQEGLTWDIWMEVDLPWVEVADAVLRLPGKSRGADWEEKTAKEKGILVFYSLEDLLAKLPATKDTTTTSVPSDLVETDSHFASDLLSSFAQAISGATHPSSQSFYKVLVEAAQLHARKQKDYGTKDDPFANIRASAEFGIEAFRGCLMRFNDKVKRLKTYCQTGILANEGVVDSLFDAAVYALIGLVLFREKDKEKPNA